MILTCRTRVRVSTCEASFCTLFACYIILIISFFTLAAYPCRIFINKNSISHTPETVIILECALITQSNATSLAEPCYFLIMLQTITSAILGGKFDEGDWIARYTCGRHCIIIDASGITRSGGACARALSIFCQYILILNKAKLQKVSE